ncbi:MAG: HEAT repeat domain-containing protein [Nitrospirae bacterium]|nr:MAG: HEAT repeat domain-containing protein [Nitrospirota bacterium]
MASRSPTSKPVNLFAGLMVVGLAVAGIWVWNHLPFDTQDYITDEIVPMLMTGTGGGLATWLLIRSIRRRRHRLRQRDALIAQFQQERSPQKRLELAFELVELNRYELKGLEPVAESMAQLFLATLKTALGDKQHRIRGMAASYLGVLQYRAAIPSLIAALEDEHAHVRACAALALGRMRASEAKHKLQEKMKEDWDQTVRSRAREAVERIPG